MRLAGVAPVRWALEDVAAPYEPYTGKKERMDCTDEGPDGFMDLTLKFDAQDLAAALGAVNAGDVLVLQLTGQTLDGRQIVGEDVMVVVGK